MRVSVIIPTLNAGSGFRETLDAIFRQRFDGELEVIVVDSGSTDGTIELCREYPIELIQILPEEFGHGRTRNLGISHARGEFVVLLVQDALPANAEWLQNLVASFTDDPKLAGVYSRQLARPDADRFTRKMMALWEENFSSTPREIGAWIQYEGLSWEEKALFCTFSNVSSCIRMAVWERYPFRDLRYAEDLDWARTVLERGYRIAFVPQSLVYHSHQYDWRSALRRSYIDGKMVPTIFEAAFSPVEHETILAAMQFIQKEGRAPSFFSRWKPGADLKSQNFIDIFTLEALLHVLGKNSPWMAGQPSAAKRSHFVFRILNRVTHYPKQLHCFELAQLVYVCLRMVWHMPCLGGRLWRLFVRKYESLLKEMWSVQVLFWALLNSTADASLSPQFTDSLLYYIGCLNDKTSGFTNVWPQIVASVGGQFLGRASYAAELYGVNQETMKEIEQWIMG